MKPKIWILTVFALFLNSCEFGPDQKELADLEDYVTTVINHTKKDGTGTMTNTIVFDEEQLVFKILIEQSTGEMMTNEVTARYSDIDLDSVEGSSAEIDIKSRAQKKSFSRFVQYEDKQRTVPESKFEIPIFIGEREATYEETEAVVEKLKQYLSLRGVKPFTIAPEEEY